MNSDSERPTTKLDAGAPRATAEGARTPLRALIIEDSRDDAALLIRELERSGYDLTATRVQSGRALEEALNDRQWDIAFCDWAMPQFSALDALDCFSRLGIDIPFIIVSGTVGEDVAVAGMRAGAHDFFSKGKLTLLVPAIERELREARMRRERTEFEQQLMVSERMASVGLLAAGVAHEINNPLASLLGNLSLALPALSSIVQVSEEPADLTGVLDHISAAHEAAERIRDVVSDLKLFARGEDDSRSAVDVEKVLKTTLRMAENETRHRCTIITEFGAVPPVAANESRLGQVFLNLIVNAAQSIDEGHAADNNIIVKTLVAPEDRVMVLIRDTGSGMSFEATQDLFVPFYTTKPRGVGTGIGLTICHRIVSSFDGTIAVESTEGIGTEFRVYLPVAGSDPVTEAPVPAPTAPARRASILVIDDEPMIVRLVAKVLQTDHDVTITTRARDALDLITSGQRFDLIFCDLMMPEMSGMDFHEMLHQVAPDQVPRVVFLSGGAFTTRAQRFLMENDTTMIEKPFDVLELQAFVSTRMS